MKTISRILSVVLCLAMVIGFFTFGAAAEEQTITWTASTLGTSTIEFTSATVGDNLITLSATNNGGNNSAAYNKDGTLRLYNKNSLVITPAAGITLTKIVFTTTGGTDGKYDMNTTDFSVNVGTLTTGSKTASITGINGATSVTLTSAKSSQIRISDITFTYTTSGSGNDGGSTTTPVVADGTYVISSDTKAITALSGSYGYLPAADITISNGKVSTLSTASMIFTITNVDGGVTIKDAAGKYYGVGYNTEDNYWYNSFQAPDAAAGDNSIWIPTKNSDGTYTFSSKANSYIISFSTYGNFAAYAEGHSNISNSNLTLTSASSVTVLPSDPVSIGSVLEEAETGKYYKVTGVVTYINYKSVHVQDETGALCLYFNSAPSDLALGDVITAMGTYKLFSNALPELEKVGEYTKVTDSTLTLDSVIKTIKLADLTAEEVSKYICSYVKIENLSVVISDGKTYLTDGTDQIQWYKINLPEGVTLADGDTVITYKGSVGNYGTTEQLVNTLGSEISVCQHPADGLTWTADSTGHWQVCGGCETKLNICTNVDLTPVANEGENTHHWACPVDGCGYKSANEDHNYTGDYIVGENGHYQKCVCLAEGTEAAHTDTDNNQKCDACNTNVDCNHSWVDQKDDTKHWEECEHCEEVRNEEDHTLTGNKNDTHHWTECECGHKTAEVAHTLTTEKNDTHHWSVCACGYKSAEVAHTLTNNKCECGYEKVEEGYFKVTEGVLTSGKYVLVASNGWAPTVLDGNWVLSAQPTVSGNEVTDPKGAVVTLTVDGNTVKITDANGKTIFNSDGGTKMTESDTAWNWKYEDGVFTFGTEANDEGKIRYLSSNSGSDCKFRAYYPATEADQWGNEYFHTFTLYKMSGTPSSGSGNTGSGDATPGNPEPPAEPFKPDTGVKEPTAGTAYKFGMYQENLGKYLYFAGSLNDAGYYLATTENYAEAVDVYVETTEGGYYLYFMNGETKTYIDLYVNGTYVNLRLVTEPGAVFAWNTEYQTFTTKLTLNDEELDYYMGTYKEYNTISGSKLSYAATSFPTHLYAEEPAPTGDNSVVSVAVAALIVSILGVTALVMKKKEF